MKHAILLAAATLSSCATLPPVAPNEATLTIGQRGRVGPLSVTPIAIVEDSRCPASVQCVWAGRVVARTLVDYRGGAEQLDTDLTLGKSIVLPEGQLTLVRAEPARSTTQPIAPAAYQLRYHFTPRP